jgi:hypothetical protein
MKSESFNKPLFFGILIAAIAYIFISVSESEGGRIYNPPVERHTYGFLEKYKSKSGSFALIESNGQYDGIKLTVSNDYYDQIDKNASCINFEEYSSYKKSKPDITRKTFGLIKQVKMTKNDCAKLMENN